jgi:hypothetical protein
MEFVLVITYWLDDRPIKMEREPQPSFYACNEKAKEWNLIGANPEALRPIWDTQKHGPIPNKIRAACVDARNAPPG